MTSFMEICNLALTRIGAQTINSLDEASAQAIHCNLLFGPTRDAVLRQVPWRFATARQALALLDETHPPEWTYGYQKPPDCLAARYIEPTGPLVPHGAIYPHSCYDSDRVLGEFTDKAACEVARLGLERDPGGSRSGWGNAIRPRRRRQAARKATRLPVTDFSTISLITLEGLR